MHYPNWIFQQSVKINKVKFKIPNNIIWPLVVLAVAFGAFYLKPWQIKPAETVSVTADGKADAVPNIAKITATIESKNPDIEKARAENEQKVSTVVTSLKQVGVEEKDTKTQNISAGPGYENLPAGSQVQIYPPQRRPNTNSFSTSLEITIRNFQLSDQIIATLTQNGATNLYGPQLTLSEDKLEEAKTQARENAVISARKKAGVLAKASGRSIGKAVKITEAGDYGYPIPLMAQSSADLVEKSSQIMPGQNEVTINLTIDFELE